MMTSTRPLRLRQRPAAVALTILAASALAACQQPRPQQAAAVDAGPAASQTQASVAGAQVSAPLPASEYFENLTEAARTAPQEELQTLLAQARTAANRDKGKLGPQAATALSARLQDIDTAMRSMSRADLAIGAVEAFRLFVSDGTGAGPVPTQVSLLDYAGFRYAVDLWAEPVRWDDASLAADFANAQWNEISSEVKDVSLRGRFGAAVISMTEAVRERDTVKASRAAQSELDLVDALETYFSTPSPSPTKAGPA